MKLAEIFVSGLALYLCFSTTSAVPFNVATFQNGITLGIILPQTNDLLPQDVGVARLSATVRLCFFIGRFD